MDAKNTESIGKYKKALSRLKERSETLTNQAKENKEELAATKAKAIEDLTNIKKEKDELKEQLDQAGSLRESENKWKELYAQEKKEKEELLVKSDQLGEELATTKAKAMDDVTNVKKERDELKERLDQTGLGKEEENKWEALFSHTKKEKE